MPEASVYIQLAPATRRIGKVRTAVIRISVWHRAENVPPGDLDLASMCMPGKNQIYCLILKEGKIARVMIEQDERDFRIQRLLKRLK